MYEINSNVPAVEIISLDSITDKRFAIKIVVAQKEADPSVQCILVQESLQGNYVWSNFYLRPTYCRTSYVSVESAIRSRFEKGYRVFIMDNKSELKQLINTRT